mmetsp:Transcript_25591/g.38221  ORF Transcript_25591/g.38221 Transcript_25591/m.38221 type:complete len:135 (-) Transcript_25591:344-748(-)|eukprot:CAMPEP_0116019748 /NCGR_PEP_ID=MMETSP0321-20121206/9412_1 /TAXON_ID=163516 /ORGANISM="Leptocylindrus danicus var. danicus, Strain B650" /LENGTH=134 /DNA_ID=CAMNT_0003490359 /DNA_START=121 /DNA_END=525 /DNA_ORIENTATION=+
MVYNPLHRFLLEQRFDKAMCVLRNNSDREELAKIKVDGDLPLHTALRVEAPDDMVIALLECYPEAANIPGRDNLTAKWLAEEKKRSKSVMDLFRPSMANERLRTSERFSFLDGQGFGSAVRTSLEKILRKSMGR